MVGFVIQSTELLRALPVRSVLSHQSYLWMLPRCSSWQLHAILPLTSVTVVDDLRTGYPRTVVLEPISRTVRGRLGDLVSDASCPPLYPGSYSAPRCLLTRWTISICGILRFAFENTTLSPTIRIESSTFHKARIRLPHQLHHINTSSQQNASVDHNSSTHRDRLRRRLAVSF